MFSPSLTHTRQFAAAAGNRLLLSLSIPFPFHTRLCECECACVSIQKEHLFSSSASRIFSLCPMLMIIHTHTPVRQTDRQEGKQAERLTYTHSRVMGCKRKKEEMASMDGAEILTPISLLALLSLPVSGSAFSADLLKRTLVLVRERELVRACTLHLISSNERHHRCSSSLPLLCSPLAVSSAKVTVTTTVGLKPSPSSSSEEESEQQAIFCFNDLLFKNCQTHLLKARQEACKTRLFHSVPHPDLFQLCSHRH